VRPPVQLRVPLPGLSPLAMARVTVSVLSLVARCRWRLRSPPQREGARACGLDVLVRAGLTGEREPGDGACRCGEGTARRADPVIQIRLDLVAVGGARGQPGVGVGAACPADRAAAGPVADGREVGARGSGAAQDGVAGRRVTGGSGPLDRYEVGVAVPFGLPAVGADRVAAAASRGWSCRWSPSRRAPLRQDEQQARDRSGSNHQHAGEPEYEATTRVAEGGWSGPRRCAGACRVITAAP